MGFLGGCGWELLFLLLLLFDKMFELVFLASRWNWCTSLVVWTVVVCWFFGLAFLTGSVNLALDLFFSSRSRLEVTIPVAWA